jgi:zinc protease
MNNKKDTTMKNYILSITVCLLFIGFTNAQVDRSQRPVPGPAPAINLATPQSFEMNNGLKVMVVRNTKLPRVRIQLLIDNPLYASEDKAGVESILASMLGNGTTSISRNDFNEEVDFLGASINFGAQSGFASSLSKYFERVFELFADATINPLMDEEEFNKEKDRLLESIRSNRRDVSSISRQVSSALLYGRNHPRGEFMTEESVQNITFADVKNYYNNFFSPENAYLVVIGDVEYPKVQAMANMYFANWPKRSVMQISYSDPKDLPGMQINFVDMPNAVQSELVVQNVVNLKMSDPDYFPVLIANNILGGDFSSYLNMNLREDKGWTYGARSSTGAGKHVSRFIASTSVRNAVTDSAVVEMIKEIRNIREHLVDHDKLALAKASFTGSFVMALERPETIANYALSIQTQNLPKDFYENYLRKINAVTAEDVKRVANKYYNIDRARIVVVGKGSEVIEGLKNIDRGDGTKIPVRFFDPYGNEVEEPNYKFEMDASVTKEAVLNSYFDAIGGKAAMQKVNTILLSAEGEIPGAPAPINLTIKTHSSGKLATEMNMMGMSIMKQVVTQDDGYMVMQGQRQNLEGETLSEVASGAHPFPELALLNNPEATLKGIERINDTEAYVIKRGPTSIYFDVATGLKIAAVTEAPEGTTSMYYSNYQEVNGVKFAKNLTIALGPQLLEFNDATVLVNEGVSEEDFK